MPDPLIHLAKNGSSKGWITTTKRIVTLNADEFVPSHGDLQTKAAIQKRLADAEAKRAKIQDLVAQGKSLDEIRVAVAIRRRRWASDRDSQASPKSSTRKQRRRVHDGAGYSANGFAIRGLDQHEVIERVALRFVFGRAVGLRFVFLDDRFQPLDQAVNISVGSLEKHHELRRCDFVATIHQYANHLLYMFLLLHECRVGLFHLRSLRRNIFNCWWRGLHWRLKGFPGRWLSLGSDMLCSTAWGNWQQVPRCLTLSTSTIPFWCNFRKADCVCRQLRPVAWANAPISPETCWCRSKRRYK